MYYCTMTQPDCYSGRQDAPLFDYTAFQRRRDWCVMYERGRDRRGVTDGGIFGDGSKEGGVAAVAPGAAEQAELQAVAIFRVYGRGL